MKWNHLPVAGGLYDQHPDLIEQFSYIFEQRALEREREQKREERKRKNPSRGASRGRY